MYRFLGLIRVAVAAVFTVHVSAQEPQVPPDVQVELQAIRDVLPVAEKIEFQITIRNIGVRPVLLNGGGILPNGDQIWAAVTCHLRHQERGFIPLMLRWGNPVMNGPDFLGLPLRPGDSHTLRITRNDYSYLLPDRLQPGQYDLACTFISRPWTDDSNRLEVSRGVWNAKPLRIEFTP